MDKNRKKKKATQTWRKKLRPLRHRTVACAFDCAAWGFARINHRSALMMARWLGRVAYLFAGAERRKIRANLDRVYGNALSRPEKTKLARRVFESVSMMGADGLNSVSWTDDEFRRKVHINNFEHWESAIALKRGVLMVTGHLGSWEAGPAAFNALFNAPMGVIMRESNNKLLNDRIVQMRTRRGISVFTTDSSPLPMFRFLKRGGALGILADQDSKYLRSVFVDFMGHPAKTPVGPAHLSRMTRAPIIPCAIVRSPKNLEFFEVFLQPPIYPNLELAEEEDLIRMTQEFAKALENQIRQFPEQWAWMHERWKSKPKPKPKPTQ